MRAAPDRSSRARRKATGWRGQTGLPHEPERNARGAEAQRFTYLGVEANVDRDQREGQRTICSPELTNQLCSRIAPRAAVAQENDRFAVDIRAALHSARYVFEEGGEIEVRPKLASALSGSRLAGRGYNEGAHGIAPMESLGGWWQVVPAAAEPEMQVPTRNDSVQEDHDGNGARSDFSGTSAAPPSCCSGCK